jgi:hypothetical protein
MNERAIEATCKECGRPLSLHENDARAVRCAGCFDEFLRARDVAFLSSYAELGVVSRLVIAESSLRQLVTETPPRRKVLAMHIMDQYVQAAGDLIGLYAALKQRGRAPLMQAFLEFKVDRNAAVGFFREILHTPGPDLLATLGIPTAAQVPHQLPSLSKKDAKDLARAIDQLLYDLGWTARQGESAALALAQMAGESRAGAALVHQSDWLDNVGLQPHQVASMALDARRRTVSVTAVSVDEKKLEGVVTSITAMTRAAQNLVYAVLSVYQEDDRRRAKA